MSEYLVPSLPPNSELLTPPKTKHPSRISEMDKVDEDLQKLKEDHKTIVKKTKRKFDELAAIEERISNDNKLREENLAKIKDRVKLNVGGKKFETTKSTLTMVKDSYFSVMLSSGQWLPDEEGYYFIDRNPKYFSIILDYFRTGKMAFECTSKIETEMFNIELDFYQITLPEPPQKSQKTEKLHWDPFRCGKNLELSNSEQTVRKFQLHGWNAGVLASEPVDTFKVQINSPEPLMMMIGFAESTTFAPDDQNCMTCGWYLYALNGTLFSHFGDNGRRSLKGVSLTSGSVLEVSFNPHTKEISYGVDGGPGIVAFTNVNPKGKLYPAADFCNLNSHLTLI